jgi:hypothetical protein
MAAVAVVLAKAVTTAGLWANLCAEGPTTSSSSGSSWTGSSSLSGGFQGINLF